MRKPETSVFGWCNDGFHEGRAYEWGTPCKGKVGDMICECWCHQKPQKTNRFTRERAK